MQYDGKELEPAGLILNRVGIFFPIRSRVNLRLRRNLAQLESVE